MYIADCRYIRSYGGCCILLFNYFFMYTMKRERDWLVLGIITRIFCSCAYSPYNTQIHLYSAWIFFPNIWGIHFWMCLCLCPQCLCIHHQVNTGGSSGKGYSLVSMCGCSALNFFTCKWEKASDIVLYCPGICCAWQTMSYFKPATTSTQQLLWLISP